MEPTFISKKEYVRLLNKELRQHLMYEKSMGFRFVKGTSGRIHTGIDWVGDKDTSAVFTDTMNRVAEKNNGWAGVRFK